MIGAPVTATRVSSFHAESFGGTAPELASTRVGFYLTAIVISGPGIEAAVNRRLTSPGARGAGSRKLTWYPSIAPG